METNMNGLWEQGSGCVIWHHVVKIQMDGELGVNQADENLPLYIYDLQVDDEEDGWREEENWVDKYIITPQTPLK